MAVRVTDVEVKEIMDTSIATMPFIVAANLIIDNTLSAEIAAGDFGAETLKEIERWLAAHMVAARDPQIAREQTGDAAATYQGKFGDDLKSTSYGQRVLLLDHTGKLASAQGAKRAKLETIMQ